MDKNSSLIVFQDKKIRRIWHNDEWYFSVVDIIQVLTDSPTPRQYWGKVKDREFIALELSPIWVQLKLRSDDGKYYLTDCSNTKDIFRIIQSIPSPKAEPFKLWLAQVGYERIQEMENPELAQNRMKEYYEQKGYPKEWIEKRLRGIAIRQELTDEWKSRGVAQENDFAILTNEISKASFGKTIQEYKEFKGLKKKNQNLRDHMSDWELLFNMIGEKATTDITKARDAKGMDENKKAANRGGQIAHNARNEIEKETGNSLISKENFLRFSKKTLMENNNKKKN